MIRLSKLSDYAVVIMTALSGARPTKLNATDVSAATGIPQTTVAKLLGHLARADLLESHRGHNGGFALSRDPEAISIADIIEAVDGPISLTNCIDDGNSSCSITSLCGMRPRWQIMNQAVRQAFEGVSLAEMAQPAAFFDVEAPLEAQSARG
ncbi:MAG: SUF system Fe-S cluster assembly regulator [Sphingomonadales bacterium]